MVMDLVLSDPNFYILTAFYGTISKTFYSFPVF